MIEKPKVKPTDEFVVPYSLQESIYRILETRDEGSTHFVPLVEKVTSETYNFRLQCLRMKVTHRKFTSQTQEPVVEVEGQLQALDDNSTLVTARLHFRWIAIVVGIVISIGVVWMFLPYMPAVIALGVTAFMALVWFLVARQLYADSHTLRALLYNAMSE